MACLYITEQASRCSVQQGKFIVSCQDGSRRMIPEELLETVVVFGRVEMTSAFQQACLKRGISVSFLSTKGHYFGRLESTSHVNPVRLKHQIYLSDNPEQSLLFAKKTLQAKIHNQQVLLRRYARNSEVSVREPVRKMEIYKKKIEMADTSEEVLGYEGIAAREYFSALSRMVKPEFRFQGRNKRPPKDPFNSMLSLGYTIAFYEIYAEVESRGMTPYVGFVHKIKERHPALVSDMLEEWRAVIVDAVVMSMIQKEEVTLEDFQKDEESGAVILSGYAVKTLIRNLERKMQSTMKYLEYLENPVSFRRGIWWQVKSLAHCLDENDLSTYQPMRIR